MSDVGLLRRKSNINYRTVLGGDEAYIHYKDYEAYFNGDRELTMQEKIQLKEEIDEYRREHDPLENNKGRFYND